MKFKQVVISITVITAILVNSGVSAIPKNSQIDFEPNNSNITVNKNLQGESLAKSYLQQNLAKYHLETNFDSLQLSHIKSSLMGKHYHFKQYIDGIEIDNAEIIVSISEQNQIIKVFNYTFPKNQPIQPKNKKSISNDLATKNAWDFLQVSGKLYSQPKSQLTYIESNKTFKLVYKVNLSVSKPNGDWEFYIDTNNGKVIQARRIDLPIAKNANEGAVNGQWQPFPKNKNFKPIENALAELSKVVQSNLNKNSDNFNSNNINKTDATALIFDPDPRTTLNDESLQDNSPTTSFDAAYQTRTLRDITLDNGIYQLTGPWVSIIDWDSPTSTPSTTNDGNWNEERGNFSFNDAMTYFHIDQNQRYIQSLGFTGSKGIQELSIEVDANGADGDDNSFYSPSNNRLSFGHGGVDDNEDADVILHEYGHAIAFSINANFDGGDSGAIGEGFGDYWAVSYSFSTANGRSFRPEWVFTWDGHNNFWPGRRVDRTNYRYNSSQTYGAHEIVNNQNGDEIWSTPLVETLKELMDQGIDRSEVDQIILEAQFGLGFAVTMPQMARSIVDAAKNLFPNGPHASVFEKQFKNMNILTTPAANDSGGSIGWLLLFLLPLIHSLKLILRLRLTFKRGSLN